MATVREATLDLFRAHGMTTIFGNPGSTELPMLADFPEDFTYVLGLQELVVVGMADGFAQASGRDDPRQPAHRAGRRQRGRRHLQRPGQQVAAADHGRPAGARADHDGGQPHQPRRDPRPAAVREVEPRAARARRTCRRRIARAIHHASLPPRGPAFVSIPMDDWDAGGRRRARRAHARARVDGPRDARPGRARGRSRERLAEARNPVLIAGPDIDASGGWDAAVALAERQRLAVWATPATGGGRLGFPENHPNFQGVLPPGDRPGRRRRSTDHDLVLVVGSSVFPYYPYIPGPLLRRGHEPRADHQRPRARPRARRWARRSSATWRSRSRALLELLGRLRARAAAAAAARCPASPPRPTR